MNELPKYAYPYPAQGYYQGPPVMPPPQYYTAPPPRRDPGFLEVWQLCVAVASSMSVAATLPSSSCADLPLLLCLQ
ncbi:protein CYSTEINE-RICH TRANSMEMBRANE MODULE 11-like [Lycium ferocissimum]|uniref:protein CYSTEINE-RICH TRANSMEMBRANE MODULE 11-like n=1 Tax=Lycium ferocissimum TaxID=112874 RepID=UPI002815B096|nr:protein CYSTEINE-RICH TRANSMEMBRANE MODULE 11-like [Lycium ferocissimum]